MLKNSKVIYSFKYFFLIKIYSLVYFLLLMLLCRQVQKPLKQILQFFLENSFVNLIFFSVSLFFKQFVLSNIAIIISKNL